MDLQKINATFQANADKPLIKLQELPVGEQQIILGAQIVKTKFGKSVLLELDENRVFLPKRVTDTFKPILSNFTVEGKYAVVFKEEKDIGKVNPMVIFEIAESQ